MTGRVDDRRLDQLYRRAGCVVAPAYREDYGLTVLEAHARARPVIVCRDGGGLVDLVDDGVTGLVVEPTGRAIADAIAELRDDPTRQRRWGPPVAIDWPSSLGTEPSRSSTRRSRASEDRGGRAQPRAVRPWGR